MQAFQSFDRASALNGAQGSRILCLGKPDARAGAINSLAARFAALGCEVDVDTALPLHGPSPDHAILVVDCDSLGSDAGADLITRDLPVILVSAAFEAHSFPESRDEPIRLRAPVSALSLRIGFDHALRDRQALAPA